MVDEPDSTPADDPSSTPAASGRPGTEGEPESGYLGVVDPVESPTHIIGVIRSRPVDGYQHHEIFTRSLVWKDTILPVSHGLGRTEIDLIDINPATAHAFVERIVARAKG